MQRYCSSVLKGRRHKHIVKMNNLACVILCAGWHPQLSLMCTAQSKKDFKEVPHRVQVERLATCMWICFNPGLRKGLTLKVVLYMRPCILTTARSRYWFALVMRKSETIFQLQCKQIFSAVALWAATCFQWFNSRLINHVFLPFTPTFFHERTEFCLSWKI